MLEILSITAPIFILIGLGFLARHRGLISPVQLSGIGTFVLYCTLPALVINALTRRPLEEVIDISFLFAYGVGSLLVFGAGFWLAITIQRKPFSESAIQALGMSASNSGFVGFPVAAMVFGTQTAGFVLALAMLIENLLIIPGGLILAEIGLQRGARPWVVVRNTLTRLARNPILIGIVTGVALSATQAPVPAPISRVIEMLAGAAAPAALFVIGGTLYGLQTRGMARNVSQLMLGKLVLHPLAILALFALVLSLNPDFDPTLLAGGLLFASCPMISVYPLLGSRFGMEGVGAAALMATTVASFITLSAVIWALTEVGLVTLGG